MVLFFCLTTLQNWQNCPAALTNHSGFLSIQLGFFRTSRGGANTKLEETAAHVVALSILLLNLRKIQCAFLQFWDWLLGFLQSREKLRVVQ